MKTFFCVNFYQSYSYGWWKFLSSGWWKSENYLFFMLMSSYSLLIDNRRTYVDRKIQQLECQRYEILNEIPHSSLTLKDVLWPYKWVILLVAGLKPRIRLRKDRFCFLDFLTCQRIEKRMKCEFELIGVKGSILEDKVVSEALDWRMFHTISWKYGL